MSPEIIFGIVIASIIGMSLLRKLLPKREPKEKQFKYFHRTVMSYGQHETTQCLLLGGKMIAFRAGQP